MTFVTNVPCAHVTGTRKRLFFYCDRSQLHARKGQWRQNYPDTAMAKDHRHNARRMMARTPAPGYGTRRTHKHRLGGRGSRALASHRIWQHDFPTYIGGR